MNDADWSNISDHVREQQKKDRAAEEQLRREMFLEGEDDYEERIPVVWAFVIVAALATLFGGVLWVILWMLGVFT